MTLLSFSLPAVFTFPQFVIPKSLNISSFVLSLPHKSIILLRCYVNLSFWPPLWMIHHWLLPCVCMTHVNKFFLLLVDISLSVYFAFSVTEYKRVEEFFPPLWSFLGPFDFSRDRFISILLPGCPLFSRLFFFWMTISLLSCHVLEEGLCVWVVDMSRWGRPLGGSPYPVTPSHCVLHSTPPTFFKAE